MIVLFLRLKNIFSSKIQTETKALASSNFPRKLFRHQAAFSPPIDESAKLPRNKALSLSSMK
jgi:hypothetical protein